eukprot:scaffold20758_cov129-Isochrysis_galbana.AAC.2
MSSILSCTLDARSWNAASSPANRASRLSRRSLSTWIRSSLSEATLGPSSARVFDVESRLVAMCGCAALQWRKHAEPLPPGMWTSAPRLGARSALLGVLCWPAPCRPHELPDSPAMPVQPIISKLCNRYS